jgi:hypothetical protein
MSWCLPDSPAAAGSLAGASAQAAAAIWLNASEFCEVYLC